MRAAIGDLRQRRIAGARGPGGEALVVKNTRDQIPNICFVVDNQNVICHGSSPSCQLPVAASIFVSLFVASAGSVVSDAGWFVSGSGSFISTFAAWPDTANRNRIQ